MRLILTSLALAALLLLPPDALAGILRVPAACLDYIAVLLHELGHVALRWSFGYPALPALDFRHGGGVIYPFDRSIWLLFGFYAVAAAAFCWGMARRVWWFAALVSILTGLHLILAFNYRHEALCSFMGLGAEVFAAMYCIIRSARGEKMGGWAEQYFNMLFGIYVMGRNIVLTLAVYANPAGDAAAQDKAAHVLRDVEQIAGLADIRAQAVALFALGFTVSCAVTALGLAIFLPPRERLGTIR
ncbi:MAG: hypothetical protein IT560_02675 [Alphaproteobacteria bacterium]|nr:hypothetical protein [Alphaproteobacteria bacterium]